jgi:hypothetical protein
MNMACSCKTSIEGKLLTRFIEQSPDASKHEVELTGYALILDDAMNMTLKGCMKIEATADHPLRKGGVKRKVQQQNMVFTFCPFCGVKYEADKVAAPADVDEVPA